MTAATTTQTIKERALAAFAERQAIEEAEAARRGREEGAMLRRILSERLGIELESDPFGRLADVDGVWFSMKADWSDFPPDSPRAWTLYARVPADADEYGDRTSGDVPVESLADLGGIYTAMANGEWW